MLSAHRYTDEPGKSVVDCTIPMISRGAFILAHRDTLFTLQTVYVELQAINAVSERMVLESCYATPNGESSFAHPYYFIQNGYVRYVHK